MQAYSKKRLERGFYLFLMKLKLLILICLLMIFHCMKISENSLHFPTRIIIWMGNLTYIFSHCICTIPAATAIYPIRYCIRPFMPFFIAHKRPKSVYLWRLICYLCILYVEEQYSNKLLFVLTLCLPSEFTAHKLQFYVRVERKFIKDAVARTLYCVTRSMHF